MFIYMSEPGYDTDNPYGPSVPLVLDESDYKAVMYINGVAICEDAYGYDVLYTDREPRCFGISDLIPNCGYLDMENSMPLDGMIRELIDGIDDAGVASLLEWLANHKGD